MKPVITKEDVGTAIAQLISQGKKPTLMAVHAALGHKGSMSTLVRLKGEIEAETNRSADSPEALRAFRDVWTLARAEGRKEQESIIAELQESLQTLATENERLQGITTATQNRASDLEKATAKAELELKESRAMAERNLGRAMATAQDSVLQAAKALQDLADARQAHANQIAALQAQLVTAQRNAHEFELELVRAQALLDPKGLASGKFQTSES
jgi:chromosome segregation ATPase